MRTECSTRGTPLGLEYLSAVSIAIRSVVRSPLSTLLYMRPEQIHNFRVMALALGYHGENTVIGREYFVRQATILFKFAKASKDPKISAALLEKAADLKSQVDEQGARPGLSPLAPDVEPPAT